MAKIVDTNRFVFGLILIIAPIVITSVFQLYYILAFAIAGIAFMIDGVTARTCPNGHIVYMWSRFYKSPNYCPTCGAPLDGDDEESSDEYYQRASGPRSETS